MREDRRRYRNRSHRQEIPLRNEFEPDGEKRIRKVFLSELTTGSTATIICVHGQGPFRKRITEMGFVKGKKVIVVKDAPLKDPVEYQLLGYNISLRRSEARMIEVLTPYSEEHEKIGNKFEGVIDEHTLKTSERENGKSISVALVGNPNSGKTSLFNFASKSKEHVGNYSGVTVDVKEANFRQDGYDFLISDLPGTYSITEYTPEELFVRKHILEKKPDIVVNVIDASNLERNLYLTTQLIDMNIKVVIALNMYDELKEKKIIFDYTNLGKMIGIPIIPTVSSKGEGIENLFSRIIDVYEDRNPIVRHIHINYGSEIERSIKAIQQEIRKDENRDRHLSTRYLSIKLLEKDRHTEERLESNTNSSRIKETSHEEVTRLENLLKDRSETLISDAKYGFIAGALKETYKNPNENKQNTNKDLDKILTHKTWGFPIFFLFLWITFQATFVLGNYPTKWIGSAFQWIGDLIRTGVPDGPVKDLLTEGIIGGIGSVIVFLPNILILFFFLSFMEDSGYMARAAFIMDKLMHKIGLHGKSFIPLIMGFGCNVPAIMATRTLENKNDRLHTMLLIPFMSCSGRLPLYILLISAFFTKHQGGVLFLIYLTGIFLAILFGVIFKKLFFSKQEAPFVMELPPYRMPTLKNTTLHMWEKGYQYLKKIGTVILLASIIIWALGYFPQKMDYTKNYSALTTQIKSDTNLNDLQKASKLSDIQSSKEEEHMEKSYIGKIGHFIEPVLRPLGFDWKIGICLLSGAAAKEIVVSSMGVLYPSKNNGGKNTQVLKQRLKEQTYTTGEKKGQLIFSPLVALTLMIFILVYFPCIAVIATIKRESNWKWASFVMLYTTGLAWILSFSIYQIGSLL